MFSKKIQILFESWLKGVESDVPLVSFRRLFKPLDFCVENKKQKKEQKTKTHLKTRFLHIFPMVVKKIV